MVNISTLSIVSALPPANIPLVGLEVPLLVFVTKVKSPKFWPSPSVAIVTKSMKFELLGVSPPANNALVEFDHESIPFLAAPDCKSPKSTASPSVDIVIKSITSVVS